MALTDKMERLIKETISDLLDEMFMDLEGPFAKVLTRNWINSSESIDTICVTIEDYTQVSSWSLDCKLKVCPSTCHKISRFNVARSPRSPPQVS